jgi:amino-acid N-acetyltransferase
MGYDGEGKTFRVNSDGIAVEVAEALQAMKILFLNGTAGPHAGGELVRQLSIAETEEIVKKKRASVEPRLLSKLEHGARACRQGVSRVHLLDGRRDEALLTEVFSHDGIGTMIYSNEYQQIRRIFKKDVRVVMALIRQSVNNEELVRRTRADIVAHLEDYWVLEIDRNVIGCVAVHLYTEEKKAELACLYVHKNHEGSGHGRKLMAFAEQLAAEKGMEQIFALSTQAFHFFQQKGTFIEVTPDQLPPERKRRYEASARHSKIMMKALSNPAVAEASRV